MLEGWEWIDVSFEYSLDSRVVAPVERGQSRIFCCGVVLLFRIFQWSVLPGWIAKLEYFSWFAGRCFFFFVRVIVYCVDGILPCDYFACRRFLVLNLVDWCELLNWDLVRCAASWGWTIVDGPSLEPLVVVFFSFLFWILSREFYLFFFILFFWHLMDWGRLR